MNAAQRDIVLVPFPFSDQSGRKVRPAIVVSNSVFNQASDDVLLMGMTSNIAKEQYTVLVTKKNLEEGTLKDDCCIKVENILKIDKSLVIKKIDRVTKETLQQAVAILGAIVKPE